MGLSERDSIVRGFTMGVFDCAHAGHIYLFARCLDHCDELTISIMDDDWTEKNKGLRPLFPFEKRKKALEEVANQLWGGACVVLPTPSVSLDATAALVENSIDCFFHGSDWLVMDMANMIPKRMSQTILEKKIDCIFLPYFEHISTSEIREAAKK